MKKYIYLALPLILMAVFFYFPLIKLFHTMFSGSENPLSMFTSIFQDATLVSIAMFTFKQATYSTLCSLGLGIPLAYFMSHYQFLGKKFFETISFLPFILPTITVALGFILFLGRFGWVNQIISLFGFERVQLLYSFTILLIAHTFYNFPIVMKIVGERWRHLNQSMFDAAKMLGAGFLSRVFRILIPALLPAIIQASVIVFVYCFMSFGIILILGKIQFSTIEVSLYMLLHNLRDYNEGTMLALIQILCTSFFLFLSIVTDHYFNNTESLFEGNEKKYLPKINWKARVPFSLFMLAVVFFFLGPLLSVGVSAFVQNRAGVYISNIPNFISIFSNKYDAILGTKPLNAVYTSSILAFLVGFSVAVSGFLASIPLKNSRNKFLEFIFLAPLGVSSITFTFAFILYKSIFLHSLSNLVLLFIIHFILSFPMSFRILLRGIRSISDTTLESGYVLGGSKAYVLRHVLFPQMKSAFMLAFIFSFTFSMGEIGAASLLKDRFITIPVALYRYINTYNFAKASIFAFFLMFFSTILLLVLKKYTSKFI